MKKEEIEQLIIDQIKRICNIEVKDKDINLFGGMYKISPRDMLYITKAIESILNINIANIFINVGSEIMTINNLSTVIFAIQNDTKMAAN